MKNDQDFLMVSSKALPSVFLDVIEAKRLLKTNICKTIQEATKTVGISRSTFYKYKDLVFPFYENTEGRNIIIAMNLDDLPGVLSIVLKTIAESSSNILTINQTIPINKVANVTITMKTNEGDISELFNNIQSIQGVHNLKILGRE